MLFPPDRHARYDASVYPGWKDWHRWSILLHLCVFHWALSHCGEEYGLWGCLNSCTHWQHHMPFHHLYWQVLYYCVFFGWADELLLYTLLFDVQSYDFHVIGHDNSIGLLDWSFLYGTQAWTNYSPVFTPIRWLKNTVCLCSCSGHLVKFQNPSRPQQSKDFPTAGLMSCKNWVWKQFLSFLFYLLLWLRLLMATNLSKLFLLPFYRYLPKGPTIYYLWCNQPCSCCCEHVAPGYQEQ